MHLIPNPRAYQALDGAFTLQDGEKVKSELRIPLVRTTTREAGHCHRNPALQKEAYTLNVTPEGVHHSPLRLSVLTIVLQSLRILADYDIAGVRCPAQHSRCSPLGLARYADLDESRHFWQRRSKATAGYALYDEAQCVPLAPDGRSRAGAVEIKKYPALNGDRL